MATQERFEPGQIEFFPGSYGSWMVAKVGHVRLVKLPELRLTCVCARMLSISQQRDVVQMWKGIKRTQSKAIIGEQELAVRTVPHHPGCSERVLR